MVFIEGLGAFKFCKQVMQTIHLSYTDVNSQTFTTKWDLSTALFQSYY